MKKVLKEKFVEFLGLLKLTGFIENSEVLLESNSKHLITYCSSLDKDFALRGEFQGEFPDKDEVGIAPLDNFIKYVKLMDEEFLIDFKTNRIHLKSKSVNISTVLKNKDYFMSLKMNKLLDPSKFENKMKSFDNQFCTPLSQEVIQEIVKTYKAVPSEFVILDFKKSGLTIKLKSTEAETNLSSEFPIEELKKLPEEFFVVTTRKFIDLLGCVKTDLKLYVDLTNPKVEIRKTVLCVKNSTPDYNFCYFFALSELEEEKDVEAK